MPKPLSIQNRKVFVLVNYICLPLILALFYLGKYHGWNYPIFVGLVLLLAVSMATFRILHMKTKLWHQIHSQGTVEHLDERQIKRRLESISISYSIFSVTCLMVIFAISFLAGQNDSMIMLVYVVLIYLAHTLPSSVLAWIEKEV